MNGRVWRGAMSLLLSACASAEPAAVQTKKSLHDDKGMCADTCPKDCAEDAECDTGSGELCCDYGDAGKACVAASACPRFCDADDACDTQRGEGCVRTRLATTQMVCAQAEMALKFCSDDSVCAANEECCGIFDEPVCVPTALCPKACSQGSECATQFGEVCCTTLALVDSTLAVSGLCLNPTVQKCPTPCSQSTECNTQEGELCCDGICSTSCPKECDSSNECSHQICCQNRVNASPWVTGAPTIGYEGSGSGGPSCPAGFLNDGYCDEPNPCPYGTDTNDCSSWSGTGGGGF